MPSHPKKDKIDKAQMAAEYGFALAFMKSDPELWSLFNQAVKGNWTSDRFAAKLRNTKWFKSHSAQVRNAILQKTGDPATWNANVDAMESNVKAAWGKLYGTYGMNEAQMRKYAETAVTFGWSDAQLMDHLVNAVNYHSLLNSKEMGGTAAETDQQLDQLLSNYGVNLGQSWKEAQIGAILSGKTTAGAVQDTVKNYAKQLYGGFSDALDSGQTMAEIADPYKQRMADLLEMNPNELTLSDSLIQKALTQKDQDGKFAPMTLADFSDAVRQDKRWQYTDNAKQTTNGIVEGLLQSWGLLA